MNNKQIATLNILYLELPVKINDPFIEIRQWQTVDDEHSELIVEFGHLKPNGELITTCQIKPFYMSVDEILVEFAA